MNLQRFSVNPLNCKKQKIVAVTIAICFTISAVSGANSVCGNVEPFATLVFRTTGGVKSLVQIRGSYVENFVRQ